MKLVNYVKLGRFSEGNLGNKRLRGEKFRKAFDKEFKLKPW